MKLKEAGVKAEYLSGDRSQSERERALNAFKRGQVNAIVATDVAARGIDIPSVTAVVHMQPPQDESAFVHRSGRTGRAGKHGHNVVIADLQDGESHNARRGGRQAMGGDGLPDREFCAKVQKSLGFKFVVQRPGPLQFGTPDQLRAGPGTAEPDEALERTIRQTFGRSKSVGGGARRPEIDQLAGDMERLHGGPEKALRAALALLVLGSSSSSSSGSLLQDTEDRLVTLAAVGPSVEDDDLRARGTAVDVAHKLWK